MSPLDELVGLALIGFSAGALLGLLAVAAVAELVGRFRR